MEQTNDTKDTKFKLIVLILLLFSTTAVGLTYAYFASDILGNDEASSVGMSTALLGVTYTDGNVINISNVFPGWSTTKTFTVSNDTENPVYYDIKLQDVYSTYLGRDLVYILTSTNSGGSQSETVLPNNDGLIAAKVLIGGNATQTYTLTIRFKELNDIQDYNQNAAFTGKIQIISPYTYTENVPNNIKLVDRIMLDNTAAYATNTSSKYVTSNTGIDYSKASGCGFDGYKLYEEQVNFTSNSNKTITTSFTYDDKSGLFKLSGTKQTSQTYGQSSIGKYTCNDNFDRCNDVLYKIVEVSGSTVTSVIRYMPNVKKDTWNGLGLYQTSTDTIDNQTTYFFRGDVLNNYVSFANDLWRIVRINEDGSIRLIREYSITSSKFNSNNNNAMYIGFMYGTTSDPYSNTNDSIMKTTLETYYDSSLSELSDYIAPIEFCNDRSIGDDSGDPLLFGGHVRLRQNSSPIFSCPNESRDLFTMTTSSRGNKKLTKPIGLITSDELLFAGIPIYQTGTYNYLLTSEISFYTSTPAYYWSTYGGSLFGVSYKYIANLAPHGSIATRPVISLNADVLVSGGSGSSTDPYVIAVSE